MFRTAGGAILMVSGIFMLFGSSFFGHGSFLEPKLFALALIYVGQQWYRGRRLLESPVGTPAIKNGTYPAGFQAAFWNKNIALDTAAGTLWLRDGETAVLRKDEIVSVDAQSDSSNHQTNIGPRTVHLQCRLLLKTRNLAKPVWMIYFNAHPPRTMGGSQANYKELHEWDARIRAFIQS